MAAEVRGSLFPRGRLGDGNWFAQVEGEGTAKTSTEALAEKMLRGKQACSERG